ncbi:AprI/Inh family metalloprotease inhibitor [Microvirga lenta]|uniref:AprI/Inh family metalloprotease inhibitor n=1 Tax=Microvirga lenta TaxID=2881337 RepID=UPI001CFF7E22|nr:AprI/Inh family metalloprotease inhibitor [Microvirga lenta]MCB5177749.1 protease inhibitor Inh/omp19 family protein [Microvirga lenta]
MAILSLAACNNVGTAYRPGPWGQARHLDPATPVYSGPWLPPRYQPVDELYYPPPPAAPAVAVHAEPMEPIGSWAERNDPPPVVEQDGLAAQTTEMLHSPSAGASYEVNGIVSKDPPVQPSLNIAPSPAKKTKPRTGSWIMEAGGSSCRLQLSSTPALDLYKASTDRCASKSLQNVNAWSARDGEIVLYSHGTVVAQLKGNDTSYFGTLESSGAAIKLTR